MRHYPDSPSGVSPLTPITLIKLAPESSSPADFSKVGPYHLFAVCAQDSNESQVHYIKNLNGDDENWRPLFRVPLVCN